MSIAVAKNTPPLAYPAFSWGPIKVQVMDINIVAGDTSITATAERLSEVDYAILFANAKQTAVPTYSKNVATFTIADISSGAPAGGAAPGLGSASTYALLAGTTITNTGASVITGDLGLYAGSAVTGFPPGTVSGTQHIDDNAAIKAKTDLTAAYLDAAGRTGATDLSGQDLGGQTLTAGVYSFSSSAAITGTLTLDGASNAQSVWIFQIGSTLTAANSSVVALINSAAAGNVFWQVGSSATIGTSATFKGNVLALTSIAAQTSAGISGRLLARNGAVTLDTNTVAVANVTAGSLGPANGSIILFGK